MIAQPSWLQFHRIVIGQVLMVVGLGTVWRSWAGAVVGSIMIIIGVLLVTLSLRKQRRVAADAGQPTPPWGKQILVLVTTTLLGAAIYTGLVLLLDRT